MKVVFPQTVYAPSGQENKRLCGFGIGVLNDVDVMSNVDFPVPSLHENELEDEQGEGEKTPESSLNDSETLSSESSTKNTSATRTSSTERGRRDLERISDDRCIIQWHLRHSLWVKSFERVSGKKKNFKITFHALHFYEKPAK